jgi:Pentapeptide repeats (8 copies)
MGITFASTVKSAAAEVGALISSDPVCRVAFVAAVLLFFVGLWLLFKAGRGPEPKHDGFRALGASIVTGVCVTLAMFILQGWTDKRAQREDFRLQVALTSDLRGFDPRGQDMSGMHLAGKDLTGANLAGASLVRTVLRGSNLVGAKLDRARLQHGDLVDADLTNAVLTGARLNGADLRGATLDGAQIVDVDRAAWKGVKANWHTCWPRGFNFGDPEFGLVAMPTRHNPKKKSLGRYCDERKTAKRDASAPR